MALNIRQFEGGVVLDVKVVPGSSRTKLAGMLDGMVKVKVAAAAEKGKANRCLIEFLAKELGVKKKAIEIISGKTSPVKQVQIEGVCAEDIVVVLSCD
jgi:uncharacterized protein (TIGR00251 family)